MEVREHTVTDHRTTVVVGGGPAGLMAALRLSEAGERVTVIEAMGSVGRKFLLAGKGGLNLTHSQELDSFLSNYRGRHDQLDQAIRAFSPRHVRSWCAQLGEPAFVGSSGRVFPASFRATPLLRTWVQRLLDSGVHIICRTQMTGLESFDGGVVLTLTTAASDAATARTWDLRCDAAVLALGGASWPKLGSTGSWVELLREHGVGVSDLTPSNCGVLTTWSSRLFDRFERVPLKNISVTFHGATARGDAMITEHGMEGAPVYAVSSALREALTKEGPQVIWLDFMPDVPIAAVVERLQRRRPKDSMSTKLRGIGLSTVAAAVLRESTSASTAAPVDNDELARLIKATPVAIRATESIEHAISSAGGIRLDEVDHRWMLRSLPGVFVAGEMLDWDAPTGGYLLQACLSTGVAAAQGVLDWFNGGPHLDQSESEWVGR